MAAARAKLKRALERSITAGHPWIWRDALAGVGGELPAPGKVVTILDRRGRFIARGLADPGPIGVRIWTLEDRPIDDDLLEARIAAAIALRRCSLGGHETNAMRWIHGEGDRLPGVVLDVYDRVGVLQLVGGAAASRWLKEALVSALRPALEALFLSGDRGERATPLFGEAAPERLVTERGMKLWVNLLEGQKTGLFLDHRESRARVRSLIADLRATSSCGARVLNLYGYTGGFSIAAGLGGAEEVITVDVAREALELAKRSWGENGLDHSAHKAIAADVPQYLRQSSDRFDLIVSDPPSFAPNQRALENAMEAYVELHRACLSRVEPGGFYLAGSCSSHIEMRAFVETLREGARRAKVPTQLLEKNGAPLDHPRLSAFPEGDYLKVVLLRVPPSR